MNDLNEVAVVVQNAVGSYPGWERELGDAPELRHGRLKDLREVSDRKVELKVGIDNCKMSTST